MKSSFVSDGYQRLAAAAAWKKQYAAVRAEVWQRYLAAWSAAGWLGRMWLRFKISRECRRACRAWRERIEPSPEALY